MKFNFSIEKTDVKTNETVLSETISTNNWNDVYDYWNSNGIESYESIENLVTDLNKYGKYDMYCNTEMLISDGLSVRIKASKEKK